MFRGIRQNSTGIAAWPWVDLGFAAYSGDGAVKSVGINVGSWNSQHTGDTGSDGPSQKFWYESDFYATLGIGFGGGVSLATHLHGLHESEQHVHHREGTDVQARG